MAALVKYLDEMPSFEAYLKEKQTNNATWTKEDEELIPEYKAFVVDMKRENFPIAVSAKQLGIEVTIVRGWLNSDPDFKAAYNAAHRDLIDTVEVETVRRAREGMLTYIVSQGRAVMDPKNPQEPLMERVYSDRLAEFILKGNKRETYGDRVQAEVTHGITESAALERFKSVLQGEDDPGSEE